MRLAPIAVLVLAVGCSAPAPQVVTGRIDPGFPANITTVKVTTSSIQSWHGDALVTTSPVAADGSFRIAVPPMNGVRIQLLAANGRSAVVFPRKSGVVSTALAIRPNGVDFDLGMIRYVGDSRTTPYAFNTSGGTSNAHCNDDGKDANGAMCVDDSDDDHNTCGQDDNNEQEGDHQDGADQQGDNQDGEQSDSNDGPDMGDAVAEHNFPADGCSDDQGGDQGGNDGEGGND